MKLTIERANGVLSAPPSKSAMHRRLILNALAGRFDLPEPACSDTLVTANALRALRDRKPVDLRDCGAAMRFLLPVGALFSGGTFIGEKRLSERPILPLLNALRAHGLTISADALPLSVSGTLRPGEYAVPGDVSSQFFTGLMLTLPFLPGDSTLIRTSPLVSAGYVQMTERMLREHGVILTPIENGYRIPGSQTPKPLPCAVEGDWSSAAPMLILGAILGSVTVTGLDPNSAHPDRAVLDALRQCGARIGVCGDAVTVSRGRLCGFKCSGDPAPDLVPVLAALGCASNGDSVLYRLHRLRDKESDRFDALLSLLDALGADYETERSDTIVIHGHGVLSGGFAPTPDDHRMAMAAALMSAISAKPVTIKNPACVQKSYPDFFTDFVKLGGQIDAI